MVSSFNNYATRNILLKMSFNAVSPKVVVELAISDDNVDNFGIDLNNNNEVDTFYSENQIRLKTPEQFKSSKRRSSASRYGFDDAFVELVAKQCQLVLETEEILGRGSFGTVIGANYQGNPVAAKIVNLKGKRQSDSVKNEEHALDLPPHPHIVQVLDIFKLGKETAIIILPRLRKGNLLSLLNKSHSNLHCTTILNFSTQIVSALHFCHNQGLLHLDLKPQNLLIDFQDKLRLSDFGNSRKLSDIDESTCALTLDGTVAYKAPELFCGKLPTTKADVYSFGITLWQILERETPYFGENEHTIIFKVVAQRYRPYLKTRQSENNMNEIELRLHELCRCCWDQEPTLRPDMSCILNKLYSFQKLMN